jgi:superfamily II DNA or RNA helicase
MSLSTTLSHDFSPLIRERGQDYFRQGRVKIRHGSSTVVEAQVRGSRTYNVNLDWEDEQLSADCDCPYFLDNGPCKHLWAVMLAADHDGFLSEVDLRPGMEADYANDWDEDEEDDPFEGTVLDFPGVRRNTPPAPSVPTWRKQLKEVAGFAKLVIPPVPPPKREVLYVIDIAASASSKQLILALRSATRKADGTLSSTTALTITRGQVEQMPLTEDREMLSALSGAAEQYYSYYDGAVNERIHSTCALSPVLVELILPKASRSGRLFAQSAGPGYPIDPIVWDEGEAWQFALEVKPEVGGGWKVAGVLRRGEQRVDVTLPRLIVRTGFVLIGDRLGRLDRQASFEWLSYFRGNSLKAPKEDQDELLQALLGAPNAPRLELPDELKIEETVEAPRPCLRFEAVTSAYRDADRMQAELQFEYGERLVPASDPVRGLYEPESRRYLRRDFDAERAAAVLLTELGLRLQVPTYSVGEAKWTVTASKLPRVVRTLVEAGWHIEAEGKLFRRPGAFDLRVSSGVDWFELHGTVEYGESTARLPALLEALKRGDGIVRLDDGAFGILPEEWLRRIGLVAGMGESHDDHLRFRTSQTGLLDALLATQPEVGFDENFARARDELRNFRGIEAAPQPDGFVGQLRDYQREGLGWLEFLRRFSFGGCLADDMGVGKTAQVLAMLETRRAARSAGEKVGPSLVIVPRSLVFNWQQESERFTPQLKVLDYTGTGRKSFVLADYDLILSTYGTLRRDIVHLKDVEFEYVVLDEAQAVKNSNTESAKSVRLLRAKHRLAVSGTPIENHLGELWSMFEFLNPGMLGAASVLKLASTNGRNPDENVRQLLAHALRPFILRRTKAQVARELPEKTEQTLLCEMEPPQRKLYNELRQHFRDSLLKRVDTVGLMKSKMHVLEALLRLRQAACHPGLIDQKRAGEKSAKLDVLLEQLKEVLSEGHKALVYSQFTSFLKIVRDRLDRDGVAYEYLDGATRDRQARVEAFQNNPDCQLFLISLKAGGLGLNLTAAEYVFLLDPWWNPAVEAQAVDRAHRIGQTHNVFAYRLIARDSVEEKVLELQKTKRDLANAIIGEDNSLIRNLRREDLELLLS